METVISWDKPKKKMSTEKWLSITADNAPPGVYTPNMELPDMLKWKGKHIKNGTDPRVEIRKTFHYSNGKTYPDNINYAAQVLIVVRNKTKEEPEVLISTNGKMAMSSTEAIELGMVIQEAFLTLKQ